MTLGRSELRSGRRSIKRALLPLTLLFALALAQAGRAQSLFIVNPRSSERITSGTTVDAVAEGLGIPPHYAINGLCHNADRVLIHIEDSMGATVGAETRRQKEAFCGSLSLGLSRMREC